MDRIKQILRIEGPSQLHGNVQLSGAKNSALKVIAASALSSDKIRLNNIPLRMSDVQAQLELLRLTGCTVEQHLDSNRVEIDASQLSTGRLCVQESYSSVRTSLLFLGVLLARLGYAKVPLPGGCRIGDRSHDLHIYALEKLGARFTSNPGSAYLEARTTALRGNRIEFPVRTTGGTENAILAACLAKGITIIDNAYTRPEVADLIRCLNSLGARIEIVGSGRIEVEGVEQLGKGEHTIISDNVEAVTFLTAACVSRSVIRIERFPFEDLEVPLIFLRDSGVGLQRDQTSLLVDGTTRVTGFNISTAPYPGINSDHQPFLAVLASRCEGTTIILDPEFPSRFTYVEELAKMGFSFQKLACGIRCSGPQRLCGADVTAKDLRCGGALLVAGLSATGTTTITDICQIDRGYECIEKKLAPLGARVYRSTP